MSTPMLISKRIQFYEPLEFKGFKFMIRGETTFNGTFSATLTCGCEYCGGWINRADYLDPKCMRCSRRWRPQFFSVKNDFQSLSSLGLVNGSGDNFFSWGDDVFFSEESDADFDLILELAESPNGYLNILEKSELLLTVGDVLFDPTKHWWVSC